MILSGLCLCLFLAGLSALIRGNVSLSASKSVRGGIARIIGLVLMGPLPIAIPLGMVARSSSNPDTGDYLLGVQVAVALAAVVASAVLAALYAGPAAEAG